MDEQIAGFLAFMAQEPDDTVQQHFTNSAVLLDYADRELSARSAGLEWTHDPVAVCAYADRTDGWIPKVGKIFSNLKGLDVAVAREELAATKKEYWSQRAPSGTEDLAQAMIALFAASEAQIDAVESGKTTFLNDRRKAIVAVQDQIESLQMVFVCQ